MQAIASLYEEWSQQHEMYNGEPAFMHVCKFKKLSYCKLSATLPKQSQAAGNHNDGVVLDLQQWLWACRQTGFCLIQELKMYRDRSGQSFRGCHSGNCETGLNADTESTLLLFTLLGSKTTNTYSTNCFLFQPQSIYPLSLSCFVFLKIAIQSRYWNL